MIFCFTLSNPLASDAHVPSDFRVFALKSECFQPSTEVKFLEFKWQNDENYDIPTKTVVLPDGTEGIVLFAASLSRLVVSDKLDDTNSDLSLYLGLPTIKGTPEAIDKCFFSCFRLANDENLVGWETSPADELLSKCAVVLHFGCAVRYVAGQIPRWRI